MSLGLRHALRRRKARISGLPTRTSMLKAAIDVIIYPIAILAPFALLPQVLQLYITHDAGSFSLVSWVSLSMINCAWLLYGYVHREPPIIISSAAFGLLQVSIVVGILLYR